MHMKNLYKTNHTRFLMFLIGVCSILLGGIQISLAQSITVDGNPSDWYVGSAVRSIPTYKHIQDPFGNGVIDNQFTSGSKDITPALNQRWANGQTKAKNDIANAAVVLDGTTLYFAGDRTSTNGTAQIGFWFFKNGTGPIEDYPGAGQGYFSPERAVGDLLILSDFTGGGRYAAVTVYQWTANNTLQVVPVNVNGCN
jgi:hypothetical protein